MDRRGNCLGGAGVPTAVYSAAAADDSHRTVVLLARSDRRMLTWEQGREPATGLPDDPAVSHVRDPFVFELDGRRYAVQGAGHTHGVPRILVYGCDDLSAWTDPGTLLSGHDAVAAEVAPANIWECPNLVRLGDRWVLILSLWRRTGDEVSLAGVRYLVGELANGPDGPRFTPSHGGELDRGPCFYAPQVLTRDGRVLLWAWAWERGRTRPEIAEVDPAPSPVAPPRILVDGSMIEVFDGTGIAYTTRAYPTTTSRWLLRLARPGPVRAWRLGL